MDHSLRKAAATSITGYQKYISPHKGFSCAHRLLYGGESCSAYLKRIIQQQGLNAAWQLAPQRFARCRQANLTLRSSSTAPDTDKRKEEQEKQRKELALDCLECGCEGCFLESTTDCLPTFEIGDCCAGDLLTPDCCF